jgi:effector-binding domain-containing protein
MPFVVLEEPEIVSQAGQPYAYILSNVTMEEIGSVLPALHRELRSWLETRGMIPSGSPFFKYNVIDMERTLKIEVGFPVPTKPESDGRVSSGALPAGKYVVARYECHPKDLIEATRSFLEWAETRDIAWDVSHNAGVERWAARVESYVSEPPNMEEWVNELAFLTNSK